MTQANFCMRQEVRVLAIALFLILFASSSSKLRPVSASGNYIAIQSVSVSGCTVTITGQAYGGKTHYYNDCELPGGGTAMANVPYNDEIYGFFGIAVGNYVDVQVQQTQFANDTYCGWNTTNNVYSFTATFTDTRPGTHSFYIEANPTNSSYNIVSGDGWEAYISSSTNYTIN